MVIATKLILLLSHYVKGILMSYMFSVFNSPDTLLLSISWNMGILLSNILRKWKHSCICKFEYYQIDNIWYYQYYKISPEAISNMNNNIQSLW